MVCYRGVSCRQRQRRRSRRVAAVRIIVILLQIPLASSSAFLASSSAFLASSPSAISPATCSALSFCSWSGYWTCAVFLSVGDVLVHIRSYRECVSVGSHGHTHFLERPWGHPGLLMLQRLTNLPGKRKSFSSTITDASCPHILPYAPPSLQWFPPPRRQHLSRRPRNHG